MAKWDLAVIGVAAVAIIHLLRQTGKDIAGALGNIKMPDIRMPDINIPETKFPTIEIKIPNTIDNAKSNLQTGYDIATYPFRPIFDQYEKIWSGWYDKLSGLLDRKVESPPSSSYFPPALGGEDSRAAVSPSKGSLEERMFSSPFQKVFPILNEKPATPAVSDKLGNVEAVISKGYGYTGNSGRSLYYYNLIEPSGRETPGSTNDGRQWLLDDLQWRGFKNYEPFAMKGAVEQIRVW